MELEIWMDSLIQSSFIYGALLCPKVFIGGSSDKEFACQCRKHKTVIWSLGQVVSLEEGMAPPPVDSIIDSMDMNLSKSWETVKEREAWLSTVFGVTKSWTQLGNWTIMT